jgi:hypothetical protein
MPWLTKILRDWSPKYAPTDLTETITEFFMKFTSMNPESEAFMKDNISSDSSKASSMLGASPNSALADRDWSTKLRPNRFNRKLGEFG